MTKTPRVRSTAHTVIGVILIAFMLFPVYWMVNVALQPNASPIAVGWFPGSFDLTSFSRTLADQGPHLATSLIVALGSVAVCLVIATPAAYALAQFRLPGGNAVMFLILISQMVPGIVIANALYTAYNDLGLLNSYVGLILADSSMGIPFAILIIRAFVVGIPPSILDAARIDGAGRWRVFISIVVPISRNALVTGGLFAFLFAWSDFLFALTLTTTETVKPITLGIYTYISAHVSNWSLVMATATMASIPAVVLLVAAQRYITTGITGGAVK